MRATSDRDVDTSALIGCPKCDEVYSVQVPGPGQRAVCARCGTVLILHRNLAGLRILAVSIAVFALLIAATFAPFLSIQAAGLTNRVSLLDVATSFGSGNLILVSVASVLLILAIPAVRVSLLIYVIAPIEFGREPARHARTAFRYADYLKAWSMAEVFCIGCAVALIKVREIAHLEFGAAFWMFIVVAILVVFSDVYICNWSIWKAIEDKR